MIAIYKVVVQERVNLSNNNKKKKEHRPDTSRTTTVGTT